MTSHPSSLEEYLEEYLEPEPDPEPDRWLTPTERAVFAALWAAAALTWAAVAVLVAV